jgi:RNA polymerase sigma-70 factor, ECF subfamily
MRRTPADCSSEDADKIINPELVKNARKGIREATETLIKRRRENVYQFVYRRVRNPHDAEDLCQDTLIKIIDNLPKLRSPERFDGWWHRIALNVVNDYFGKPYRKIFVRTDDYEEMAWYIEDSALRPDKQAIENQLSSDMWRAIKALPKNQRAVFILKEYDGLSYAEIAVVLEKDVSTIRSNHRHAKQTLRQSTTLKVYMEK